MEIIEKDSIRIAGAFGEMYKWAEESNIKVSEFKIDYGYQREGSEEEHDLYIAVL